MNKRYVILNKNGGWLENIILWDGNIETWQPPKEVIVKQENEIDLTTIPKNPEELNDPVEIILDIEEAGTY